MPNRRKKSIPRCSAEKTLIEDAAKTPMKCANPTRDAEALSLRSGKIFAVDFLGGAEGAGECQIIQRRVVWLCDACTEQLAVETWRPPEEQMRPSRSSFTSAAKQYRSQPPEAGI